MDSFLEILVASVAALIPVILGSSLYIRQRWIVRILIKAAALAVEKVAQDYVHEAKLRTSEKTGNYDLTEAQAKVAQDIAVAKIREITRNINDSKTNPLQPMVPIEKLKQQDLKVIVEKEVQKRKNYAGMKGGKR